MTQKSDTLIIGGGAIGLCTAYYLAERGLSVTLVERDEIGSACSDKNAGLIAPSHIIPLAAPGIVAQGVKWMFKRKSPFYIKPRLSLDLLSWVWQFMRACSESRMRKSVPVLHELLQTSHALFEQLDKAGVIAGCGLSKKGLLMLYKNRKTFETERREAELAREIGLQVNELQPHEIENLETGISTSAVGGVYYEQDAHLQPEAFIMGLRTALEQRGIILLAGVEVTGFEFANGQISSALTPDAKFTADEFVLAGGAWSPDIVRGLGLRLPVQAGKGYSVTVENPKQKPNIPAILVEARLAVTPFSDSLRFAGTMELAGLDPAISRRRVHAMLDAISDYYPNFDTSGLQSAEVWSGLRPCTPDGLPFIGRFKKFSNLVAATGHAMLGISLAPVTGRLVADILTRSTPGCDLSPLRVDRFS